MRFLKLIILMLLLTTMEKSSIVSEKHPINIIEEKCLMDIIYSEAANQPFHGKVAVAYVVFNRKLSDKFPDTFCEVVMQPNQFTLKKYNNKNEKLYLEAELAAKSFYLLPDPTKKAIYFHNPKIGRDWKKGRRDSVLIKEHLFYK